MYEIASKSVSGAMPWVPMATATVFSGPLKSLFLSKTKPAFWRAVKRVAMAIFAKAAMGISYGSMTPAVRFGMWMTKMIFPRMMMIEDDDDVNGNPQLVEDDVDKEDDPPNATPPAPARTH